MRRPFFGCDFLGKLHNTKQHIQFLKFLRGDIPPDILPLFLTAYNKKNNDVWATPEIKKENFALGMDKCEWFLFEICSVKLYEKDSYQVQYEHIEDHTYKTHLEEDLNEIRTLLPNKKILFQCHFRLDIIYNVETKFIQKRDMIAKILEKFCSEHENTFFHDPSLILRDNPLFFDSQDHFFDCGDLANFDHICDKFLLNEELYKKIKIFLYFE